MPLRLIETILPEKEAGEVYKLLEKCKMLEHRQIKLSDGQVLVRILLDAKQNEPILDLLEKHYAKESNRVVMLPVEATLPRVDIELAKQMQSSKPNRVSREELYEDIKDAANCSRTYLAMMLLSTIVAIIGLYSNNVAIIIGAMVIAPMLGSNMASGLGAALGDLSLLRHALLTSLIGIATTLALSTLIGIWLHVDPATSEVASRTHVNMGDLVVALASGCAGALAFTTGVSVTLIGVMVAVALLPPLVTSGLLFGSGEMILALGALSFFLVNLICVNLASVAIFLIQGVHPLSWWEKDRAVKATRIAIALWTAMLAILIAVLVLLQKHGM